MLDNIRLISHKFIGKKIEIFVVFIFSIIILFPAWIFRFFPDDAFIGYRYAKNLTKGCGLTFNCGEKVEGYSNFLWVLIHYIPEKFNWSSADFSSTLGALCLIIFCLILFLFVSNVFGQSRKISYLATFLTVTNATFLSYALGGMEVILQTLFIFLFGYFLFTINYNKKTFKKAILLGILTSLAILIRLDSLVFIIVFLVVFFRKIILPDKTFFAFIVGYLIPLVLLVGGWFLWKIDYYGSFLPNTFYLKTQVHNSDSILFGIRYIFLFLWKYGLIIFIPFFILRWKRNCNDCKFLNIFWIIPLWLLYIILIGGDFMEFRMVIPVMPLIFTLISILIFSFRSVLFKFCLVLIILLFSFSNLFFSWSSDVNYSKFPLSVLNFRELNQWPIVTNWQKVGRVLNAKFPGGQNAIGQPVLAVNPSGILPYYSDLPTIDMLGLNDREIVFNGRTSDFYYPGHIRISSIEYLIKRGVNIIIGSPLIVDNKLGRSNYNILELTTLYEIVDLKELPEMAEVIEIPLDSNKNLVVIYLKHNKKVDDYIKTGQWKTFKIDKSCTRGFIDQKQNIFKTKTCDV